jgi:hypothetical protein
VVVRGDDREREDKIEAVAAKYPGKIVIAW